MADEPSQLQRLLAEALGTGFLVFIGAGSVPATLILNGGTLSMADLGIIALAFGLVIAAAIYTFGHISGAHINPAVTVGLAMTGQFPWRDVPRYIAAQVVGAIAGAAAIIAALGTAAVDAGLGVNSFGTDHWANGAAAEVLGTFVLVFTVLGVVHRKAAPGFAGLAIGIVVFAVIVTTGPASGGSINPARYAGPFLLEAIFGPDGAVDWGEVPAYLIAQFLGGALAAILYPLVFSARVRVPGQRRTGVSTSAKVS